MAKGDHLLKGVEVEQFYQYRFVMQRGHGRQRKRGEKDFLNSCVSAFHGISRPIPIAGEEQFSSYPVFPSCWMKRN
ncbi:hypothetical protein CEXT_708461 [Caerostris extrusa]|uniref:Uncharacterized protein n=1 Tax=Caerostris extrusa TaxID=172846 RepID=A0AAV4SWR8_CAEEX|nr:hypothetical protein CEXT_708461 [Caerostris extrusa]